MALSQITVNKETKANFGDLLEAAIFVDLIEKVLEEEPGKIKKFFEIINEPQKDGSLIISLDYKEQFKGI